MSTAELLQLSADTLQLACQVLLNFLLVEATSHDLVG